MRPSHQPWERVKMAHGTREGDRDDAEAAGAEHKGCFQLGCISPVLAHASPAATPPQCPSLAPLP